MRLRSTKLRCVKASSGMDHRPPPNDHMLRSVPDNVLGRGRERLLSVQVTRARVLTGQPAGADVGRWAALRFLPL